MQHLTERLARTGRVFKRGEHSIPPGTPVEPSGRRPTDLPQPDDYAVLHGQVRAALTAAPVPVPELAAAARNGVDPDGLSAATARVRELTNDRFERLREFVTASEEAWVKVQSANDSSWPVLKHLQERVGAVVHKRLLADVAAWDATDGALAESFSRIRQGARQRFDEVEARRARAWRTRFNSGSAASDAFALAAGHVDADEVVSGIVARALAVRDLPAAVADVETTLTLPAVA